MFPSRPTRAVLTHRGHRDGRPHRGDDDSPAGVSQASEDVTV
ncbi:MAG: hypothetical protein ACE5EY_04415 [Anaerolineae bacterium]